MEAPLEQGLLIEKRHFAVVIVPLFVLIVGLLTTIGLYFWGAESNRENTSDAMVATTQNAVKTIESQLQRYQYGLRGARGAILTVGAHTITRSQFKRKRSMNPTF